jgi:hypothetical protein
MSKYMYVQQLFKLNLNSFDIFYQYNCRKEPPSNVKTNVILQIQKKIIVKPV